MYVLNRVVAAALAVALLVGGLAVAAEALAAAFGVGPWLLPRNDWYRVALNHTWAAPESRRVFGAIAAAGLTLVALARTPRRPAKIVQGRPGQCEVVLYRRNVERQLARAAAGVPGVSKTGVDLRGRRLRVTGEAAFGLSDALQPGVVSAVRNRLRQIGVEPEPAVSVNLRRGGER